MINKRNLTFGILASWLNRAQAIVLNLIFMPVLFFYLGEKELGFWFLIGQSGAFLALMDFGVAGTLVRRIAFAYSHDALEADGLSSRGKIDHTVGELIAVARVVYRYLALAVFVIGLLCGYLFLQQIDASEAQRQTVLMAWFIMCCGHGLGVWASLWTYVLQGLGYVGHMLFIGMAVNLFVIGVQLSILMSGGGLIALSLAMVGGVVLTRLCLMVFVRLKARAVIEMQGEWRRDIFSSIYRPALKSWLTVLGGFLVLKTDQYFIAAFRGVGDIPAYHAAYQLTSNLYMLAVSLSGASGVFVSQLWQRDENRSVRRLVMVNMKCGLSIMACGLVCLGFVGEDVINLWLGAGYYVGYSVMLIFCITLFLQTQHEMLMTLSRATEDEAYVYASLAAGGLNIIFTYILIQNYGLVGVALGTLFAQLLTNNWFGMLRSLLRLGISLRSYAREVLLPVLVVFAFALGAGSFIDNVTGGGTVQWVRAGSAILVQGGVLAIALLYYLRADGWSWEMSLLRKGV